MEQGMNDPKLPVEDGSKATPKKRNQHPDRVTLEAPALARLDVWIKQLKLRNQGIEISRKDLLNWMVLNRDEALSSSEQKQLTEEFYDEEKFLRYAWEEIRSAKSKGEKVSLEEILSRRREAQVVPRAKKVRTKSPTEATSGQPLEPTSSKSIEAKSASSVSSGSEKKVKGSL